VPAVWPRVHCSSEREQRRVEPRKRSRPPRTAWIRSARGWAAPREQGFVSRTGDAYAPIVVQGMLEVSQPDVERGVAAYQERLAKAR
jgi:hypothetical protein